MIQRGIRLIVAFTLLSLLGCENPEQTRLLTRIEIVVSELAELGDSDLARTMELKTELLAKYDSLLTLFPNASEVSNWQTSKSNFAKSMQRDKAFWEISLLVQSVSDIERETADDLKTADSSDVLFEELNEYMDILVKAEAALTAFTRDYPDDPLADSVHSYLKVVSATRVTIEYLSYTSISMDLISALQGAQIYCSYIANIWGRAINAGLDFNEWIDKVAKVPNASKEDWQKLIDPKMARVAQALTGLSPPKDGPELSVMTHRHLENMYVNTQQLVQLAYNPRGSLMSYSSKVNELVVEAMEDYERFQLANAKLSKSASRD